MRSVSVLDLPHRGGTPLPECEIGSIVITRSPVTMSSTGMGLGPISPGAVSSLVDAVTESIREAILAGRLAGGHHILPEQIASEMGVSRQPVREALKQLRTEGLILQLPNRRLIVREYTDNDIRENYLLRRILEGEAARIAAAMMTADQLDELEAVNEELAREIEKDHEPTRILQLNYRFHFLIRAAISYPMMRSFIDSLWMGITIATPLYVPGRAERSVTEHATIVRAMKDRDPEGAAAAMLLHITGAAKEYFGSPEGCDPLT